MSYTEITNQVQNLVKTNGALVTEVTRVRDSAMGMLRLYETIEEGRQDSNIGQYFSVPGDGAFIRLYRKTSASQQNLIAEYPTLDSFNDAIALTTDEPIPYTSELTVTNKKQLYIYEDVYYQPSATVELPFTTTNWGADEGKFVSVGDAVLRGDLSLLSGIKDLKPIVGIVQNVKGFYQGSDVGGGQFYYDANRSWADHNGGTVIAVGALGAWDGTQAGLAAFLNWVGTGSGCFVRENKGQITTAFFGTKADGINDDTAPIIKANEIQAVAGAELVFTEGNYLVKDTIIFNKRNAHHWVSKGKVDIIFENTVQNKPLFLLDTENAFSSLKGFFLTDKNKGTSTAIRLRDMREPGSTSNWKNYFERLHVRHFNIGVVFDAFGSAADGSLTSQDFCSESLFSHCRFRNCRTAVLNRNQQALNNTFIQTDLENDDDGEQYTLIRDEAGGGLNFYGGSLIGRGRFFEWIVPVGSTAWNQSALNMVNCRMEVRAGHIGQVFYQDPAGSYTGFSNCNIRVTDCTWTLFGQTVDLIHYTGRVSAIFKGGSVINGNFLVRNFAVAGISGSNNTGSQGRVLVIDYSNTTYIAGESDIYGTIQKRHRGIVDILGSNNNSRTMTPDADGFWDRRLVETYTKPFGLCNPEFKRMIWNDPSFGSGFKEVKFLLPIEAQITKLICFKQPVRRFNNMTLNAYLVKDKSFWIDPSNFNKETDAILVCSLNCPVNTYGYFDKNINPSTTLLGNVFEAGNSDQWQEGRFLIESDQSTSTAFWSGWVGIEYI